MLKQLYCAFGLAGSWSDFFFDAGIAITVIGEKLETSYGIPIVTNWKKLT